MMHIRSSWARALIANSMGGPKPKLMEPRNVTRADRRRSANLRCISRAAWVALSFAACDVYDSKLVPQVQPASALPGDAAPSIDATPDLDATLAVDAAPANDASAPDCLADPDAPDRQCCHETCNAIDDDCDGQIDEGDIGSLCQRDFASSECAAGACIIASCDEPHVDCNHAAQDGCETTLDSPDNCGVCGHVCAIEHASARCSGGNCGVASCAEPFGDCDGKSDNGCEAKLDTVSDCGTCGHVCRLPHASSTCAQGECGFLACDPGFGDCNHDAAAPSGNGCETELNSPNDCGGCGRTCSGATPYCSGGQCTALACPAGKADCDRDNVTCETDLHSVANCGACAFACGSLANATASCPAGSCLPVCTTGFQDCDASASTGCETDVRTNSNCGSCGKACAYANASASCTAGVCQIAACTAGYGDCNGNPSDGCEQRLNDNAHCGQCGKTCALANAAVSCSSGSCAVSNCNAGFANCDGNAANGCEANLNTSNQNCGKCSQVCASNRSCVAGACVCTSNANCSTGQLCCSGACVDTRSDEANCGACGAACTSTQTCCSSSCKTLATDINNCGTCGSTCDSHSDRCTAGQCKCGTANSCGGFDRCCTNGCARGFACH